MRKTIVFDLDLTLWWCEDSWIYMCGGAPFTSVDGDLLVDCKGRKLGLYPQSRQILEELCDAGYTLAVASRSEASAWAEEAMELLNLKGYFESIQIYGGDKQTHFKAIQQSLGCEYENAVFYDDEQRNIESVSELGVECVHVVDGVKYEMFGDYLGKGV